MVQACRWLSEKGAWRRECIIVHSTRGDLIKRTFEVGGASGGLLHDDGANFLFPALLHAFVSTAAPATYLPSSSSFALSLLVLFRICRFMMFYVSWSNASRILLSKKKSSGRECQIGWCLTHLSGSDGDPDSDSSPDLALREALTLEADAKPESGTDHSVLRPCTAIGSRVRLPDHLIWS